LGIIQKQSISGLIWSYLGVGLGFILTAILFTRFLTTEEIGLIRLLVSYSTVMAMFASMGMNAVTIKMFPQFRNEKEKHHGFLGIALIFVLIGFLITTICYLLLQNVMIADAREKSELFIPFFYVVIPLTLFTLLFGILDSYYRVLFNAVKGIAYKEVYQRILIISSVTLYYFGYINFSVFVWFYVLAYGIPVLLFITSLIVQKKFYIKPRFDFIDKKLKKELIRVALFGIFASFSGILVQSIDIIMVNEFMGLSQTGIYTISFFFGTLILIPMRSMAKIGAVVVSESWKINDTKTISAIYLKSSLTLSVIGLLIFIGIWGNIDNVFYIIGNDYSEGKYVILFIGLANLTDVYMGLSSQILVNSKYYKWLTYLLILFAALIVLTNFFLIPAFGIIGAALASFVSKLIFNLLKFVFIKIRFGFQPFNKKHLILTVIAVLTWYLSTLLPTMPDYIIDIIIRSSAITIVFMIPVYYFNISEDINDRIDKVLDLVGINLKKR